MDHGDRAFHFLPVILDRGRSGWFQGTQILSCLHSKKKKGPVTAEVKAPWTVLTPSDQEEVGSKTQYLAGEETRLNVSGSYKVREMILTSRHWALMPVLGELCSLNLYKNPGG